MGTSTPRDKRKKLLRIPVKQYWGLYQNYLQPQRKSVLLLGFLLLGNIVFSLLNPQIIRNFLDSAQAGASQNVLLRASLLFLGFACAQQLMTVLGSYVGEIVAWTATNKLRIDLADHCLRLDLSFHNLHTPGEMIERLDGDIKNLANFFSRFVIDLIGNALLMIGVLALMWWEDRLIGAGLTIFVLISIYIMLRYRNLAVPYWAAERQASAEFYGFLEERLFGIEDIRANGAESYVLRKFHALIRQMLRKSLKSAMVINILININHFLFAAGTATAFAIAAFLFKRETITIGTVYLIYHYTVMLNRPIESISRQVEQLQLAGASIVRIQELLLVKSKLIDAPLPAATNLTTEITSLGLEFKHVVFGYDDTIHNNQKTQNSRGERHEVNSKDTILKNISFTLEPGKVLGILGRTGSGKTTLTRLVFRFYDPDKGVISIYNQDLPDRTNIQEIPLKILRRQIGIVTQNIQLFNASVRDNLTFFDPSIPDNLLNQVIEELGLRDWYKNLPDGLDTVLESGGGGLSAGEGQLLALTRIFLSKPGLLILDEASSRLDPATDKFIDHSISKLLQNRTAIIIAHRLETVMKADRIMILENGRIAEHGDRIQLASNPASNFSKLLKTGLDEVLV